MNAQKREVEIRCRVHVTADQVGAPGPQLDIVSAEWDDAHVTGEGARQPIRIQTGAIEHDARFPRSVRGEHARRSMGLAWLDNPPHGNAELHPRAGRSPILHQRRHVGGSIEARPFRCMQRLDTPGVRLDPRDTTLVHARGAYAVGLRPSVQLRQRCALGVAARHDQNAALLHGDAALATVLAQRPAPLYAVLRLQAARLEVVACVDNAAVAATLVLSRPVFLFEECDPHPGPRQVERRARADGAGADDNDVGTQARWPFSWRYARSASRQGRSGAPSRDVSRPVCNALLRGRWALE